MDLRLSWLVVCWYRPPYRVFCTASTPTLYSRSFPPPSYIYLYYLPRSRSRFPPILYLFSFLQSPPPSVFQSLPTPSLVFCSPLGTTTSGRRQVVLQELLVTCKRQFLSAEMMQRTGWQYLFFPHKLWIQNSLLAPFLSPLLFPLSITDPVPELVPIPVLDYVVRSLSRLLLCVLVCLCLGLYSLNHT